MWSNVSHVKAQLSEKWEEEKHINKSNVTLAAH